MTAYRCRECGLMSGRNRKRPRPHDHTTTRPHDHTTTQRATGERIGQKDLTKETTSIVGLSREVEI